MATPVKDGKPGSNRVWRLILVGAVIGAVAALVYAWVKKMTQPKQ